MMTTVDNGTEPGLQSGPHFNPDFRTGHKGWGVIVAGGSGSRLARDLDGIPKQFMLYRNAPLYWHSARSLAQCAFMDGLVFVFPQEYCEREQNRLTKLCARHELGVPWLIAAGGKTRSESARNGVALVPADCTDIFIHDAARPFLKPELVYRLHAAMRPDVGAVIPGIKLADTVKFINEFGFSTNTPPREALRSIQTPQLFNASVLRKIYEAVDFMPASITDDASLLEAHGYRVLVVNGDPKNIKITNPEDLSYLETQEDKMIPCIGFGYDVHRYGEGKTLKLGGVAIPGDWKVIAHSDGDVLLHALVDAILGCGAFGDIGSHFPDSDPAWEDAPSSVFVDHALGLIRDAGIKLTHLDITIVAQKPKLAPWKREIAKNVARICNLDLGHINLKATTEEGMGFTGHLEGIKAYAVASAIKSEENPY